MLELIRTGSICALFCALSPLWNASPLAAQELSVALHVSDGTGGLFQSGFAAALRELGDVRVVSSGENATYNLHIMALCQADDCAQARSYSISIRLAKPLEPEFVAFIVTSTSPSSPLSPEVLEALEVLRNYERTYMALSASWGREIFQRAIREAVARIDARCFERSRLRARAVRLLGSGRRLEGDRLLLAVNDTTRWEC